MSSEVTVNRITDAISVVSITVILASPIAIIKAATVTAALAYFALTLVASIMFVSATSARSEFDGSKKYSALLRDKLEGSIRCLIENIAKVMQQSLTYIFTFLFITTLVVALGPKFGLSIDIITIAIKSVARVVMSGNIS